MKTQLMYSFINKIIQSIQKLKIENHHRKTWQNIYVDLEENCVYCAVINTNWKCMPSWGLLDLSCEYSSQHVGIHCENSSQICKIFSKMSLNLFLQIAEIYTSNVL